MSCKWHPISPRDWLPIAKGKWAIIHTLPDGSWEYKVVDSEKAALKEVVGELSLWVSDFVLEDEWVDEIQALLEDEKFEKALESWNEYQKEHTNRDEDKAEFLKIVKGPASYRGE